MADADFFSQSTPELRQARVAYIDGRWKGLSEHLVARLDHAVTFLMLANSGGAVATLGFMGAMKSPSPMPGAQLMLGLFLAGIVLTGLLRAIHFYRLAHIFEGWRSDVALVTTDSITWGELLNRDQHRSGRFILADVIGWLSFLCFIAGGLVGYVGLFDL